MEPQQSEKDQQPQQLVIPSWEIQHPVGEKGGRPTKYIKGTVESILKFIKTGSSKSEAATLSGIERHTLAEWEEKYSDFSTAIKKAEVEQIQLLINSIYNQGLTDWRAHAWILERRHPDKFSLVQRSVMEGRVKHEHEFTGEAAAAILRVAKRLTGESGDSPVVEVDPLAEGQGGTT